MLLMTNPRKRRNSRRRRNPRLDAGRRRHHHRRRSNPFGESRRHSRRRRNPHHIAGVGLGELAKASVGAAIGGVATRGITQMLLGDKNQGAMGYAGNVGVGLGLTYLGARMGGSTFGLGIGAGAFAGIILRLWSEHVAGTSPSISGLGDLDFQGLGDFVQTPFPVPTVSQQSGPYQVVSNPYPAPALPAAPAAANGQPAAAPANPAGAPGRVSVARLSARHAA